MKKLLVIASVFLSLGVPPLPLESTGEGPVSYLGFDRNEYPGDESLRNLPGRVRLFRLLVE
jgi:hypothetical protein